MVIVNYITIFGVPFAVIKYEITVSIIDNDVNYFTHWSNNISLNGLTLVGRKSLRNFSMAIGPVKNPRLAYKQYVDFRKPVLQKGLKCEKNVQDAKPISVSSIYSII